MSVYITGTVQGHVCSLMYVASHDIIRNNLRSISARCNANTKQYQTGQHHPRVLLRKLDQQHPPIPQLLSRGPGLAGTWQNENAILPST